MHRIALCIICFLFCLPVQAKEFNCQVESVYDGDTLTCSDGTKVRLWGVDAPEKPTKKNANKQNTKLFIDSRNALSGLVLGKSLVCKFKNYSFGRKAAQCFLENKDIAVYLLKNGYITENKKYSKGYYTR